MIDEEEIAPEYRKMLNNSRIVSRACDKYFAAKGIPCYDLKGNEINPTTKRPPKKCKPTLKDSKS